MASSTKESGGIVELIKTVVYALLLAGVIRTLLFQPFWIPSGSMKDTLLIGDFLFVNKFAYGYSKHSCPWSMCPFEGRIMAGKPERGDVIVFTHPRDNVVYIKRLVGLPNERIQMRNGLLYINDQPVPQQGTEPFVEVKELQGPQGGIPKCSNAPVAMQSTIGAGAECLKERAIETLPNGFEHSVLNTFDNYAGDDTAVFTVPEGHYFFVGDNRDNSLDSRFTQREDGVGFVPFENFVGRADRIIFSSAGRSILYFWTWRADRFFKAVT